MSLSAREQQALDSIREGLTGSDPQLAALLTTFTELASGEEMPVREKIRQPWAWAVIHGGKDVENRRWRTAYRGPLLIHAAKNTDPDPEATARLLWTMADPEGLRQPRAAWQPFGDRNSGHASRRSVNENSGRGPPGRVNYSAKTAGKISSQRNHSSL